MDKIQRYSKQIIIGVIVLITLISIISYMNNDNSNSNDEVVNKNSTKEEVTTKVTSVYVDIKGAVENPGVYKMKSTARVIDVINAAGGLSKNANTSIINLSKKITDEMVIIIYTNDQINNYASGTISTYEISKKIEDSKTTVDKNNNAEIEVKSTDNESSTININTATKEELTTLSGIGDAKAKAIIKYREENGNFSTIEDIKNVSGIGDSLFEKIKDNITV